MKIGLIYNKNAGGKRREELEKIVDCFETHNTYQIYAALDKFKLSEKDILGVYGGDGTLQHTITRCFEYYKEKIPNILFIKGGTINSVADDLRLDGNAERAISLIKRNKYRVHHKPIMRIDSERGAEYGFIYGSGLIYEFIHDYCKGNLRGAPKVFALTGMMLTNIPYLSNMLKEVDAEVHVSNGPTFNRHNVMIISTVKNMGFGFKMMPHAGDHGKAQLRGGMLNEGDFFNNIVNAYTNSIRGIHSRLVDYVKIKPKKTLNYVLDGELKAANHELNISLRQIKFIIPGS